MELGVDERTCTGVEGTARSSGSSSSSSAAEAVSWMATLSSGCNHDKKPEEFQRELGGHTKRRGASMLRGSTLAAQPNSCRDTDLGLGDSGLELGVNVVKRSSSSGHRGNGGHGDLGSGARALLQ
jgi:hypothetical protein